MANILTNSADIGPIRPNLSECGRFQGEFHPHDGLFFASGAREGRGRGNTKNNQQPATAKHCTPATFGPAATPGRESANRALREEGSDRASHFAWATGGVGRAWFRLLCGAGWTFLAAIASAPCRTCEVLSIACLRCAEPSDSCRANRMTSDIVELVACCREDRRLHWMIWGVDPADCEDLYLAVQPTPEAAGGVQRKLNQERVVRRGVSEVPCVCDTSGGT